MRKMFAKAVLGYGLAMMMVFVASTVVVGASMQMMMGPVSAAYMGAASRDNMAANQLAFSGMKQAIKDLQAKYDAGTTITTAYTFSSGSSTSASDALKMPPNPDAPATLATPVGWSYTASVVSVNGNNLVVSVTATVGTGNYTLKKMVSLSHNPAPLDNITASVAAYGLRKLRTAYPGNAIRVRRSSDNTEQDIGFDPSGGLDIAGLRSFVEGNTSYAKPVDAVSGAVAAYSTRKLRQAYTGKAIRVRRSSDNTEQDIGFDLRGNLDVYALTSFVGQDSAYVKTWYDQSGNGYNATQATTANQPRIVNAGVIDTLNGRPAVRGLGAESITANYTNIMVGTGGWHYSTVIGDYGSTSGNYYIDRISTINNPLASLRNQSGKFSIQKRSDAAVTNNYNGATTMPTDGTPVVISYFRKRGTNYSLFYNGIANAINPDTDGDLTPQGPSMLGFYNATHYVNAAMGELIIYSTNLSTTNRQKLENDQARYWQANMADPGYSLPLDSVGSATAAYGLRKLRTAYGGSAIRVRRSSDNTEQDIGFDLMGNLNVASLMNFVGTGSGYVTTWYDQSSSNNATQTTMANQPRIVNAGVLDTQGGRPTVTFDGSASYFSTGSTLSITGTTLSAVTVGANSSSSAAQFGRLLVGKATADPDEVGAATSAAIFRRDGANNLLTAFRNTDQLGVIALPLNTGFQASSIFDGTNHTLYMNQIAGTTIGSIGNFGINRLWIGATPALTSTRFWQGNISEIILYSSALSTGNRQLLEGNEMAYYNVNEGMPDTGFVTKWYDQSVDSNGNDLSQTTPLLQPMIRWDNKTNRAAIQFNGINNYLTTGTTLSLTSNTATALAVANLNTTARSYGRLFSGKATADALDHATTLSAVFYCVNGGTLNLSSWRNNGNRGNATLPMLNKMVQATSYFDGTNSSMRINGQAGTSAASSGNFGINQLWMGTSPSMPATDFWTGSISEVILYPSLLTTNQMKVIESGQRAFYATP